MDFLESKLKHEISFGNNPKSFIKNYTLLADSSLTRLVIMCIPWLWIIRMSPAQIFVCEIHNIHGTVWNDSTWLCPNQSFCDPWQIIEKKEKKGIMALWHFISSHLIKNKEKEQASGAKRSMNTNSSNGQERDRCTTVNDDRNWQKLEDYGSGIGRLHHIYLFFFSRLGHIMYKHYVDSRCCYSWSCTYLDWHAERSDLYNMALLNRAPENEGIDQRLMRLYRRLRCWRSHPFWCNKHSLCDWDMQIFSMRDAPSRYLLLTANRSILFWVYGLSSLS